MIGRYSNIMVYRDIFRSSDFARIIAGGLFIPLGFMMYFLNFNFFIGSIMDGHGKEYILNGFLAISVFINGFPIIKEALKGVLKRRVNVDELVSIAIAACLANGSFFEAAIISFIMVLGSFVEEGVSSRARGAIESLMEMNPDSAAVLEENGAEKIKGIDEIKIGEIVIIRAGDIIPVDGVITDGACAVDEALLTGESMPQYKGPGDPVSAGTVNLDGYLRVMVGQRGADSTIGKIKSLIESAENSRVRGTRIVDRYAGYFTPLIVTVAAVTWMVSGDADRAIAVLVVGCPCSFLLSGPVPAVAAIGRAAKSGIIVKGGEYLEKLAAVKTAAFDKTGTITSGKPRILKIEPENGYSSDFIIRIASSVETGSTHPIAGAVLSMARGMDVAVEEASDVAVLPGKGVRGSLNGNVVEVVAGRNILYPGMTCVDVIFNGGHAGYIFLEDEVRESARKMVESMKSLGIRHMSLLSGDNEGAVQKAAEKSGIGEYSGGLLPHEKMEAVEKMSGILYVGDGINDAPSLRAADIGIAMGAAGAQVALETADVVLMNNNLMLIPFLVRLSRKMVSVIRINLVLSLVINIIAVVLSTMGLLSPVAGALVHNMGSVLVVAISASVALSLKIEEDA